MVKRAIISLEEVTRCDGEIARVVSAASLSSSRGIVLATNGRGNDELKIYIV